MRLMDELKRALKQSRKSTAATSGGELY